MTSAESQKESQREEQADDQWPLKGNSSAIGSFEEGYFPEIGLRRIGHRKRETAVQEQGRQLPPVQYASPSEVKVYAKPNRRLLALSSERAKRASVADVQ